MKLKVLVNTPFAKTIKLVQSNTLTTFHPDFHEQQSLAQSLAEFCRKFLSQR